MKKLLLSLVLLTSLNIFAQTSPFILEHCIDKMTDKEYYFTKTKLICSNENKTQGFTLTPMFKMKNNELIHNGINCKSVNIGNCNEGDKLIFMFEDDTKITVVSWNKFNCDGNAYFDFSNDDINLFSTKKIKAIRFINGRGFESFTYTLKETEKNYLINAHTNQKIVEIDCSK